MDTRQEFLNTYEKTYKRINRKYLIFNVLHVLLYFLIVFLILIDSLNLLLMFAYLLPVTLIINVIRERAILKNISKIFNKWKNDLDTEFVLDIYQQLLINKKRKDYCYLLVSYLNFLIIISEFEEFEKLYYENAKIMKKASIIPYLSILEDIFIQLLEDRSEYRNKLFQYQFTKYHHRQGKLPERKARLRFTDESKEVLQSYELKEYEKVIEKIEQMHLDTNYDKLVYHSLKQRCLYYLNQEYSSPDNEYINILSIQKWKTLIETGTEYTFERAPEILHQISIDKKRGNKKNYRFFISLILISIFVVYLIHVLKDTLNIKESTYITCVETFDYDVMRVHGLCTNDDLAAAVVYGKATSYGSDVQPTYLIAGVDFYYDGINRMMRLNKKPFLYLGGTQVYTSVGDEFTYVVVATEEKAQITYDGEIIKDAAFEKLPSSIFVAEPWISCFLIEGTFNENKLEVTDSANVLNEFSSYINPNIGWKISKSETLERYSLYKTVDGGKT